MKTLLIVSIIAGLGVTVWSPSWNLATDTAAGQATSRLMTVNAQSASLPALQSAHVVLKPKMMLRIKEQKIAGR